MKNNFKLNGGYIGLLVLLVAIVAGGFFVFKPNKPAQEESSKNIIEEASGAIEQAKEVNDLVEQNNKNTTEEVSETKPAPNASGAPDTTGGNKVITNNDNKKVMKATLHTSKGDITIELNSATPKTVENFTKLAKEGFYNGTKFHRVIKGFMSQGGDPLSKDDTKASMWGTGGPGYKFEDEITSPNKNDINTISMANAGPNTNGSQFFINAGNNNFLDTKHTVFGKVVAGMDVALAINNVATDPNDRPLEAVVIKSITLN